MSSLSPYYSNIIGNTSYTVSIREILALLRYLSKINIFG